MDVDAGDRCTQELRNLALGQPYGVLLYSHINQDLPVLRLVQHDFAGRRRLDVPPVRSGRRGLALLARRGRFRGPRLTTLALLHGDLLAWDSWNLQTLSAKLG